MVFKNKNDKGFSLLELLLVVSVGILLILAGLAIYRNVTNQRLTNETVRLVNVIKQETQKLYQGERGYGPVGDRRAIIKNAGIIAPEYDNGGISIRGPWNIDVQVNSMAGATGTRLQILLVGVPAEACANVALTYGPNDPDFSALIIGGVAVAAPSVATVTAACGGGTPNIAWQFL